MDGCVHQSLQKPEVQLPIQKKRMLGVISADPDPIVIKADILFVVVTVLVVLLRYLSSRRSHISRHKLGRYLLSGASAAYFSLISYIFSYLTTYLSSDLDDPFVLMLVVLLQFLKSNSDMAALAVAAVASPTAGDHVDSQKIRPSMESLVSSLWVAGLVIYYMLIAYTKKKSYRPHDYLKLLAYADLSIFLLWVLGVARLVLRFVAFEHLNGSFSVGQNAQLTEGYMAQLQEQEDHLGPVSVPRLIVTGEKRLDVEESPQGYRVKENKSGHLVTLDKVWSSPCLSPEAKDLCLSFSLFKCLRRRFAG